MAPVRPTTAAKALNGSGVVNAALEALLYSQNQRRMATLHATLLDRHVHGRAGCWSGLHARIAYASSGNGERGLSGSFGYQS
jgi:hypothetical protein